MVTITTLHKPILRTIYQGSCIIQTRKTNKQKKITQNKKYSMVLKIAFVINDDTFHNLRFEPL